MLIPAYKNNRPTPETMAHEAAQHEALKVFKDEKLSDAEKTKAFHIRMDEADAAYLLCMKTVAKKNRG